MKTIKTVYIGYDTSTLFLLNSSERIKVIAVVEIDKLSSYNLSNPIDCGFCYLYKKKIEKKFIHVHFVMLHFLNYLRCFSSPIYRKYNRYINEVLSKKIAICKETDIEEMDDVDIIVVNNWKLLGASIINKPQYGCLNIHPSKLPMYRGAVPTLWALKNKDRDCAVSYMILNKKMDGGDILSQYVFPISSKDDSILLEQKIENILQETLLNSIINYVNGQIIPKPQDDFQSSYTAKYEEYMKIDINTENLYDIINKIKLYPYLFPTDYCYLPVNKNKKIHIRNASASSFKIPIHAKVYRKYDKLYLNINNQNYKGQVLCVRLFRDMSIRSSIYLLFNYRRI